MRASRCFVLLFVAILACTKKNASETRIEKIGPDSIRVTNSDFVKTALVERKPFAETLVVSGKVSLPEGNLLQLSARFQGRMENIRHVVGESVKVGDVVAEVWSPDLSTAAAEWFAAKRQGQSSFLELTRGKLKNLGLAEGDLRSESQERFPLRSPIQGVILDRKVAPGTSVQPGDLLFVIGRVTQFEFVADLPPEDARKVKSDMEVRFAEHPQLLGKVLSISPVADPQTRLNRLRVSLPRDLPSALSFESLLKGEVILRKQMELVIPSRAVIRDEKRELIFVQVEPDVYQRIPVQIRSRQETETSVEEQGILKAGAQVVLKGALQLEAILEDQ